MPLFWVALIGNFTFSSFVAQDAANERTTNATASAVLAAYSLDHRLHAQRKIVAIGDRHGRQSVRSARQPWPPASNLW